MAERLICREGEVYIHASGKSATRTSVKSNVTKITRGPDGALHAVPMFRRGMQSIYCSVPPTQNKCGHVSRI